MIRKYSLVIICSFFVFLPYYVQANPFLDFREKQSLELNYSVYSGGFKIATQSVSISRISDKIYIQNLTKTTGAVDYLNHAEFKVKVIESIKKDKNIPITFRAYSETGFVFVKKSKSYVNYKNDDEIDSYDFILLEGNEEEDIPKKYNKKDISVSINWMSFLTAIANHFKKDPISCNFEATVFDVTSGNRVMLNSPKKINVPEFAYTKYVGPAIQCKMIVTPLVPIDSSEKSEVIKSSISIAEIMEDIFLPVKFTIKSNDLTLIIHLTEYNMTNLSDFTPFDIIPEIPIPDAK